MSFKVSVSKERVTPAKKNITVSNVSIDNKMFVDEEGNIAERLLEELPEGVNQFDIKITVEPESENDFLDAE